MAKPSQEIIECALKVHKTLGPGLLESVYQNCMAYELSKKSYRVEKEVLSPVRYEDLMIETGSKADLIIDNKIIIELESVEKLQPVHRAQTLTYLKLTKYPLALLINFGEPLIKEGIHRFANSAEANDL